MGGCISVTTAGTHAFVHSPKASARQEQSCIKAITSPLSLGTPLHHVCLPLLAMGSPSRHLIVIFHASPSASAIPPPETQSEQEFQESKHAQRIERREVRPWSPFRLKCSRFPPRQGFSRPYRRNWFRATLEQRRRQTLSACLALPSLCAGVQLRIRVSVVAAWAFPFFGRTLFACAVESGDALSGELPTVGEGE
jgi:hypothetical protein